MTVAVVCDQAEHAGKHKAAAASAERIRFLACTGLGGRCAMCEFMDWVPFVGKAHTGQLTARVGVGMGGDRLLESPVFELAPARIQHDFGYREVVAGWTISITSQLSNPFWLTRNFRYCDSGCLNLDLGSLGKLTFQAARMIKPCCDKGEG